MTGRIATILARSGSRGFPNKNVQYFLGETLLARTVRQARRTGLFDTVVVSSDSEAYLEIAAEAGAHEVVFRPHELANDTVTKLPGIRHCVKICEARANLRYNVVADLAVTSPLRSDGDIDGAVNMLENSKASVVLSGAEAKDNPYFNILEQTKNGDFVLSKMLPQNVTARQEAPRCVALNGAVYVWERDELMEPDDTVVREGTQVYLMSETHSIDVDTKMDLQLALLLAVNDIETAHFHT